MEFSKKVRDLLDHTDKLTQKSLHLLRVGRHFRENGTKIIIGRQEDENTKIRNLRESGDAIVKTHGFPGPTALVRGEVNDDIIELVGRMLLRYSKNKTNGNNYVLCTKDNKDSLVKVENPVDDKTVG